MMKYYAQMLEMGSFDRKAIIELTGSDGAARSIIYDYLKNGYIELKESKNEWKYNIKSKICKVLF